MILPKNRSPELYEWLEAKLEEIGLSGRVYSRLIQSIMSLDSSCLKSELEAIIDVQKKDELLAREVLLAAQWKGSKESEDYWSFREIISNFLKKYQTYVNTAGRSNDDEFCDGDTKQSGEKYDEAFPSLSNACDEIAWNIMNNSRNWSCLASQHDLSVLLATRKSASSVSNATTTTTKYYLGSYCIDEVEMFLKKRLDAVGQRFYRENRSKKQPPRKMYRRKRGDSRKQYMNDSFRLVPAQTQKKCCKRCSKRSQNKPVSSPLERIYSVKEGREITKKKEQKIVIISSDESTSSDESETLQTKNRMKLTAKNVELLQKEYRDSKKDLLTWYDRLTNKCMAKKDCEPSNVWTPVEMLLTPNKMQYQKYKAVHDSAESDWDLDGLVDLNSWKEDLSVTEKIDMVSSEFRSASDVSNGPIAHSTPKKNDDLDDNFSSLVVSLSGPEQSNLSEFVFDFDNKCNINGIQLPKMSENFNFNELNVANDGSGSRSGITGKSRRKLVFDEPIKQQITLAAQGYFEDFLASMRKMNTDPEGGNVDEAHEIVRNLLESSFVDKITSRRPQPSEKQTSPSYLQQVSQPSKSWNASAEDNNEFWHGFWSYDGMVALQKKEPGGNVGMSPKKTQKVSPLGVPLETSTLCEENDDNSSDWFTPWLNKQTEVLGLDWFEHTGDLRFGL